MYTYTNTAAVALRRYPSPCSCQVYITPDKSVEIVSTHEQMLDGQVFLGCTFPCDPSYRTMMHEYGRKVGAALAAHGAVERFAMDFVTVPKEDGSWDLALRASPSRAHYFRSAKPRATPGPL